MVPAWWSRLRTGVGATKLEIHNRGPQSHIARTLPPSPHLALFDTSTALPSFLKKIYPIVLRSPALAMPLSCPLAPSLA